MQLDTSILAAFALLWLAIVPTPGPNSLLIMRLALTTGWRDVAIALAGNLLAIAFYALATLLGLSLLLAAAPSVRLAIYLLGGAYLVWVGLRLITAGVRRSRGTAAGAYASVDANAKADAVRRPFMQGVLTALANVQAMFFLSSIFAGVGILRANLATGLAAVGIVVLGNGLYLSLLAWLLQRERPRAFYAATVARWRSVSASSSSSSAPGSYGARRRPGFSRPLLPQDGTWMQSQRMVCVTMSCVAGARDPSRA